MSEESIRKIVQNFGKYHAIRFACSVTQNPKIFRTFARDLTDVTRLLADEDDEMEEDRFLVDLYKIAKEKKLLEISNKLFKLPNMIDTVDSTDSFAVIVHGDAEPGNFLFKYTVSLIICTSKS
jgi:thiamine kinase-like enzyme